MSAFSAKILHTHDTRWKVIPHKKGSGYGNPNTICDVRKGSRPYETCQTPTYNWHSRKVGMLHSQLGMARSLVSMGVNECIHGYKAFICVASVAKSLHRISFLIIEIIVCFFMHYLLSRRAKGLRTLSFYRWYWQGESPQVRMRSRIDDFHFWSLSYIETWFWELAMLEIVNGVVYMI